MSSKPINTNTVAGRAWPHRANELGDRLPGGFTIGVASSAFQIEGAARDGGRAESTWDPFTATAGRIVDGSNASVSADHYNKLPEDLTLLSELGVDAYRFSFAWSRVQPDGRGSLARTGLAFYDRLVDGLLAAGIRPMATLHHRDLPLALRGGWLNRDTASRFADYAYELGAVFGDRVDAWVTLDEPATVTLAGYALGTDAPGEARLFAALPAAHHQLLGHGLAVQGLRAADVHGGIGIANAYSPVQPASDREADEVAAALFDLLHNRVFADAVLLGNYPVPPEPYEAELRLLIETEPEDLRTINQPLDFYGLNYVQPSRVAAGPVPVVSGAIAGGGASGNGSGGARGEAGAGSGPRGPGSRGPGSRGPASRAGGPGGPGAAGSGTGPRTAANAGRVDENAPVVSFPFHVLPFREFTVTGAGRAIAPDYLGVALAELATRYGDGLPPVYLTSIGASFPDQVDGRGAVDDPARIDYLAEHLVAALDAVAPGKPAAAVDLRGAFVWSLLDGFEWTAGYTQRYGLVRVDFADPERKRTPKSSYRWLQQVLSAR
ncbi:glycoside hydrolase family 1 protein [Cryobacterium zhongshanensis]|uniref:glycoside hydrolase family 1 protein n=1 Tax=Cryobacterium zhongshanensis TaxID=2928153 RepID=UPI00242DB2DA|nr:family 1 glycosylhydrolase [Cryobacterium zhongshanensis]